MLARGRAATRYAIASAAVAAAVLWACTSPAAAKPAYCAPEQRDALQDITGSPASPYFVRHPTPDLWRGSTVIFLPGSAGLKRNAQRVWDTFLAGATDTTRFRVVMPYARDLDLPEDYRRTLDILDEILGCYGGDPTQVHLAGFSNGGHAAFALMLEQPARFATLLGAPGEFPPAFTPADWAKALAGKSVFNGVGELDDDWKPGVRQTHEELVSVGVDCVYVEFRGQGHGARDGFDKDVLFKFWTKHSGR